MKGSKHRREFLLSETASRVLDRLADAYNCNFSDTVEGLLLGTIDHRAVAAMKDRNPDPSEARVFVEMA